MRNHSINNPDPDKEGARHIAAMHRFGRLSVAGAMFVMLGIPTVLGVYFHALPAFSEILQSSLPMIIVFGPNAFSNVISYTPILGSSIYLTLITGEVTNLKLPVVNNALSMMRVEAGTENADVISAIAVSVATFVTIFLITVCVIMMIPLEPVLSLPVVKIVSANILPALFGSLLVDALSSAPTEGVHIAGHLKGLILPTILVLLIIVFDPALSGFLRLDKLLGMEGQGVIMSAYQGFVVIAMIPITYFFTKWLYKKGQIQVYLPGEKIPDKKEKSR
ncbi:MAG: hypothetical protein LBL26_14985 [Peptococcaceae bacterium]|jgi:hypothetical protein|nr:hypothetical protein [Peptococcaceae bacterium]